MRIDGFWLIDDDGVSRPALPIVLVPPSGEPIGAEFLLDTGADNTVLTAELVRLLGLSSRPSREQFGGVGGFVDLVEVFAHLDFLTHDGDRITIAIECYAFTDANAIEMPLLGRDVTDLFTLIVDRRGDTVCLIGDRHRYIIVED